MLFVYLVTNGTKTKFPIDVDQVGQRVYVTRHKRNGDYIVIPNDAFADYPTT